MARKRIYTRVRNETFENAIAFYIATGREWESDAIRYACRNAHIPLNDENIQKQVQEYLRMANEHFKVK